MEVVQRVHRNGRKAGRWWSPMAAEPCPELCCQRGHGSKEQTQISVVASKSSCKINCLLPGTLLNILAYICFTLAQGGTTQQLENPQTYLRTRLNYTVWQFCWTQQGCCLLTSLWSSFLETNPTSATIQKFWFHRWWDQSLKPFRSVSRTCFLTILPIFLI